MKALAPLTTAGLTALSLLVAGCGSDSDPVSRNRTDGCTLVQADGRTSGDTRTLMGEAMFVFDGIERPADVGIYLNNIEETATGDLRLSIVYQFGWPNGDLVLTEDDVILVRILQENTFTLDVTLTIKSGEGIFKGMEGERPFGLQGDFTIGPEEAPSGLPSVTEQFTLDGTLCP